MSERVDVVVVGMGVGGEEVAGKLAEAGLQVVGIERELVGGECPYWACIPSEMMIRAANLLAEARRVPGMAGQATVVPDWTAVAQRIRDEATDDWNDKVAVDRFVAKGGHFIRGEACFVGPGKVQVGDEVVEARVGVVIATGSVPAIPPISGLAKTPYWTNREAVSTSTLPSSIIVLGAGAVGVELSQVFSRFGVKVTLVEALDRILPAEEPEASSLIADVLLAEGIEVRVSTRVENVSYGEGSGFDVSVADGSVLRAQRLLVATGRKAALGQLGLFRIGLVDDARWIEVNEHMRAAPGVWAVGDITGVGLFTHVAMYQAAIAVADIVGAGPASCADYRAVPRVTFSDPEVASVGLSAEKARERGIDIRTGMALVPSSSRGWIHKVGNEGMIKLVEDASRGVLVGATSVGPVGGEVLSMLTLAVHAGIPTADLRKMIYAYPTFHRGVEDALRDLAG